MDAQPSIPMYDGLTVQIFRTESSNLIMVMKVCIKQTILFKRTNNRELVPIVLQFLNSPFFYNKKEWNNIYIFPQSIETHAFVLNTFENILTLNFLLYIKYMKCQRNLSFIRLDNLI